MDHLKQTIDDAVATDVADAWETVNQLVSGFFALPCKVGMVVPSLLHMTRQT